MKNKSDAQLLAELSNLDDKSSKLRKEIDKRGRESELKGIKKYVGNYYRNTGHGYKTYYHVLYIDKDCRLRGATLRWGGSKYFTLEFNDIIFTHDGAHGHLKKIPKEKWDKIIKGLKPEINKGLK